MTDLHSFLNRFHVVEHIPLFSRLNWFDLQKIARKSFLEEYKKGDLIVSQGEDAAFFYCVVSGRVRSFHVSEKNNQNIDVEILHRGMPFALMSVFVNDEYSMNFEAINDTVVLKIPREDFKEFVDTIPQLGAEFSQTLSHKLSRHVKGKPNIYHSQIVAVYSPTLSSGCTTYALNLAMSLQSETGKKVIYVDIHSQDSRLKTNSDSKSFLKWKDSEVSLTDIFKDNAKLKESLIENELSIDMLNVSVAVNQDVEERKAVHEKIGPFISHLVGDYHYVVVDLPNDMDDVVSETLLQCDQIHFMTVDRKEELSLVRHIIDEMKESLQERFDSNRVKVLVRSLEEDLSLSFDEIRALLNYNIYKVLPSLSKKNPSDIQKKPSFDIALTGESEPYTKIIRSIARETGRVLVGLVLGGGAALGVAHIGVIRVFERENIPIDVVVGSSMGALIGGIWLTGHDSYELEDVAREFENKKDMLKLLDPVIPISGLVRGGAIKRWLKKHLGSLTFHHCDKPFKVVSYDLNNREELVRDSGRLVNAIRESISIPGVMEPIQKKGRLIIDGGVLNPLPTNVLAKAGVKKIIAVNVLQSPLEVIKGRELREAQDRKKRQVKFLKDPLGFVGHRMGSFIAKLFAPNISDIIVKTLQASEYLIAEQSARQADILIEPDLTGIDWYELYKVDDLLKAGEKAAEKLLPQIRQMLEEE